jgi:hypothetical protein
MAGSQSYGKDTVQVLGTASISNTREVTEGSVAMVDIIAGCGYVLCTVMAIDGGQSASLGRSVRYSFLYYSRL